MREIYKIEYYFKYLFTIMAILMVNFYGTEYLETKHIAFIIIGVISFVANIGMWIWHHKDLKERMIQQMMENFEDKAGGGYVNGIPRPTRGQSYTM